jgi:hypothetical protein
MKMDPLKKKLERLKRSLLALGPVLQGTILPRVIRREDPERPGHPKDYGPYYQWTRKLRGRTVIQNLTPSQAKTYGRAIRENQKLETSIAEWRATSLKLLESTTQGVQKRRARKTKDEGLSYSSSLS